MNKRKLFCILIPIGAFVTLVVVTLSVLGALVFNRFSRGVVPTEAQLESLRAAGQTYDHVLILGVDGAGGYFGEMDTPGFDSFFASEKLSASVTYRAVSQFPTESGQNWASMLHGVWCGKHGVDNDKALSEPYTDEEYPSLFKAYAELHPDASMASVSAWDAINFGIIEEIPQLTKIDGKDLLAEDVSSLSWLESEMVVDRYVCDEVVDRILHTDPKILFTHFDCVDAAGHTAGTGKLDYLRAMRYVDDLLARIYDACEEAGWLGNALFICVSDHGHDKEGGHGSNRAIVKNVTFAVAGAKGNVLSGTPGYVVTQDLASVVFYALGEKQPAPWDGSVPKNMFKGL